ncbi:MAG TPA: formate dehydrogenase accessory sulfurtransferase FdhD [Desulfatiglandales bacterium]|nr:formate dehydrogenase accessory sulfurtransferase FdhD [Desulfatiglandales bacterium]
MLDNVPIVRIYKDGKGKPKSIKDTVAAEHALTVHLDTKELVTLLCSPEKLEYLAIGFLCSEGLINGKEDLKEIVLDENQGVIEIATAEHANTAKDGESKRLIGSSGGRGISPPSLDHHKVESTLTITPVEIFSLIEEFVHRSEVFEATGGVHSAALCDTQHILVFSEDIGRHNSIDKVFGECLLKALPTDDHIVITSGRVSSEIVNKVVKRNIPILISKSAPTNRGVELAADLGITLIGFVREGRMNLYTHTRRVGSDRT